MKRERGFLLILAVILIAVSAAFSVVMLTLVTGGAQSGALDSVSSQAFLTAESGLDRATNALLTPTLANRLACNALTGNAAVTDVSVGGGRYIVTGGAGVYAAGATLTVAAGVADTAFTVSSTAGYAARGRLLIDREVVNYTGTTPTSFVGLARAADGTTAAAHAIGARLGQDQCTITSQGGVPDLTAPEARRTTSHAVQLQEGWAVGPRTGGGGFTAQNLNAIYCSPSANWCWAVGNAGAIGYWDGANWTAVASPTGQALFGVSCSAANNCWAVGTRANATSTGWVFLRWNGTVWNLTNSTNPAINAQNLTAVHVVSATEAWTVGNPGAAGQRPMILVWNGAQWSLSIAGLPAINTLLNAVTCIAGNTCWTVGNNSGGELTLRRVAPGNWQRIGPVASADNRNLRGLACTGVNDCWSVGVAGGTADRWPWLIRWNGAAWSNYDSSALNLNAQLNAVTCVDPTNCFAVGSIIGNNFTILRWNGASWANQSFTDATYRQNLNGVACVNSDPNNCWAVGNAGRLVRWNGIGWSVYIGANATVLRWNTNSWTDVSTSALVPGGLAQLNAVSMLSYADGWAVGNSSAANATGWMFLRWNGTAWARLNATNPAITARNLNAVFGLAANDAWAVGAPGTGAAERPMILWWNGANWATRNSNLNINQTLTAITCNATTDCWAVGNRTAATTNGWLVLRWNGAVWTQAAINTAGVTAQNLRAVACYTTNDCWAVGDAGARLHWDGTTSTWSAIITPAVTHNLLGLALIGPRTRPQSGWFEILP
jgi:hypothetical protein